MSKSILTKRKTQEFEIHPYDMKIEKAYKLIERDLSKNNIKLIKYYDKHMARQSLAKATRLKPLDKDWKPVAFSEGKKIREYRGFYSITSIRPRFMLVTNSVPSSSYPLTNTVVLY